MSKLRSYFRRYMTEGPAAVTKTGFHESVRFKSEESTSGLSPRPETTARRRRRRVAA
jgi:hypothetical protein